MRPIATDDSPNPRTVPAPFLTARKKLLIAGIIVGVALVYFTLNVFQGAAVYYLTVGELLDRGASERLVRVNGSLVQGSFTRESGSTIAHFRITDGARDLPAVYDGVVSALFFNEHSQIVLEGRYDKGGVFQAESVLVKCPSKYEALAEEQGA